MFLVQHEYELDGCDETKLIGTYSSQDAAKAAVKRVSRSPGFRDHPDGFYIDAYEVDEDHWIDGFVTVPPEEA